MQKDINDLSKIEHFSQMPALLYAVKLYHYRTQDQKEVDIVLESSSGKVCGIEIKLADLVRKDDLKDLMSLKEDAGEDFHHGIILYTGNQVLPFGESFTAVPITALWN